MSGSARALVDNDPSESAASLAKDVYGVDLEALGKVVVCHPLVNLDADKEFENSTCPRWQIYM